VLDEAQHIKNPDTQNAQAAMGLKARHRLVLTGTPLENSVRDLWSIMNFVMPGYLGSRNDFKERYEQPIMQGIEAGPVKSRLAKRIRPFLLRRTKREVYKELPEKLEQVVYCSMTAHQTKVYEKLLLESRRQITELSGAKDQNKGRMLMLTALLRLRQACCDLRLLGMPELTQEQASAKLELLDELLREAIDGGHRVLIFSQFVSMLQLQKAALEAADIEYCYLDGQTKDRMKVVDRFQNDPAVPVFLISLKAGGVGLNLTGADTVVHFDPWWNPAVEAQATDRAHRIGQEKVVTAYKLITRGTVEEKILKLQETKRGLMEAIESEEPVMGGLSTAEIQELLA
jgi:SNF2 family DNA or RNA helicase